MTKDGAILHYQKMPTKEVIEASGKKKRIIDIAQVAAMVARFEPAHAFIEKVHAMPKNGAVSMFSFGMGYGMILGLCLSLEALLETWHVPPQKWQKFMYASMPNAKELEPKARAMAKFYDTWPEMMEKNVTHDGIIDAILLCEYGRRSLALN